MLCEVIFESCSISTKDACTIPPLRTQHRHDGSTYNGASVQAHASATGVENTSSTNLKNTALGTQTRIESELATGGVAHTSNLHGMGRLISEVCDAILEEAGNTKKASKVNLDTANAGYKSARKAALTTKIDVQDVQAQKKEYEAQVLDLRIILTAAKKIYKAAQKAFSEVEEGCKMKVATHAEREAARKDEIAALQQAISILKGMSSEE